MKKIILLVVVTLTIGDIVYGQETIKTFSILGEEYDFQASELKEDSTYTVYVSGHSLDALNKKGGLMIKSKHIERFIACLNKGKKKYVEWTNTAKENNIKDLTKDIDVGKMPRLEGYFYYSEWKFDFNVVPFVKYMVTEKKDGSVDYAFLIYTGELTSSSNKYIDSDSFVYAFYSEEEIEEFIILFKPELVYEFYNEKNNEEDLFK